MKLWQRSPLLQILGEKRQVISEVQTWPGRWFCARSETPAGPPSSMFEDSWRRNFPTAVLADVRSLALLKCSPHSPNHTTTFLYLKNKVYIPTIFKTTRTPWILVGMAGNIQPTYAEIMPLLCFAVNDIEYIWVCKINISFSSPMV